MHPEADLKIGHYTGVGMAWGLWFQVCEAANEAPAAA
jgi:hypothetical protein